LPDLAAPDIPFETKKLYEQKEDTVPLAPKADVIDSTNSKSQNDSGDGKFIPPKVGDKLQKVLDQTGTTRETAEKVRSEINEKGQDPAKVLPDLMRQNRVVAIGETHETPNPQRDLGAQEMADLKKSGATHLAIEAPASIQPQLDEYMRTGILDPNVLPPLLRDADYLKMLEAARASGLKITAVDQNRQYNEASDSDRPTPHFADHGPYVDRDDLMAKNVGKILDQDPANKVVFWVGSQHLNQSENPNPHHKTAAELLKEKTPTATIDPVYASRGYGVYPLNEITTGTKNPVALKTSQSPTLGSLPESKFEIGPKEYMRDWDYVFVYPTPGS
jgi:hypothetical protein